MLKYIACLPIRFYQYWISPILGPRCRFYPSCSEYACSAIQYFGFLKGFWMTLKRLLRCHPWSAGGYDPIYTNKEKF